MKNKIWIVGMGPGKEEMMTGRAIEVLEQVDVIIGYTVYLDLLGERFQDKEFLSTPMRQEEKRCRMCFEEAEKGKSVAMVCSGDAGVYGMASLMYEIGKEYSAISLEVIPGITAANSGAADLMTPWELIEKRLIMAARGDFAIALYNPSSRKRADYLERACKILLQEIEPERACGYVENIGRDGESTVTCTLEELQSKSVNMFTTVFVGNSRTRIQDGKLITPRGYKIEQ